MLDPTNLLKAGARNSKNPIFNGLLAEVATYNNMAVAGDLKSKADQLMRICQIGSCYCTSKPPQTGKTKNSLRWAAIKSLLEQVGSEVVSLELRMLHSPTDFKTIKANEPSYWLEAVDPQHRAGFILANRFETWINDPACINNKRDFWDYIGTTYVRTDPHTSVKYYPDLEGLAPEYQANRGMLRFDENYKLVDLADHIWDTSTNQTHFSGTGWGIFVVSPTGEIFGGTHEAGKHHHSSFLNGGAVMAAGEIACFNGVPRIITAKSGHYRPTPQNMRNFVNTFSQIPGDTLILPKMPDGPLDRPKLYKVNRFRLYGESAPPLTKTQVEQWLNQFPVAKTTASPDGKGGFKGSILDKMT